MTLISSIETILHYNWLWGKYDINYWKCQVPWCNYLIKDISKLIRHHLCYKPQKVMYVCPRCHWMIHQGSNFHYGNTYDNYAKSYEKWKPTDSRITNYKKPSWYSKYFEYLSQEVS